MSKLTTTVSSTSTAISSLSLITEEATSMLDQVKRYREELASLPADDPRRAVYESIIRDLIDRSRRLSSFITTTRANSE